MKSLSDIIKLTFQKNVYFRHKKSQHFEKLCNSSIMQLHLEFQRVCVTFFGAVSGALIAHFYFNSTFWAAVIERAFAFSLLPVERQVVEQRTATLPTSTKELLPRNALCSVLVIHFKLEAPTSCRMLFKELWFSAEPATCQQQSSLMWPTVKHHPSFQQHDLAFGHFPAW